MADYGQLSRLTRRADAVAESASALVSRTIREIRGELANLSGELNLAGSADDRERAYAMVRQRMARLRRALDRLLAAQSQAAARGAAKSASEMTGLEVRYSAKRAEAICELVTPSQGESLAAVFTDRMGRGLIDSLREATVAAMRAQAVAGGSMKDLARDMAERWREAAKDEDPRFVDSSGRTWDTATYFQMNVRTNTMRVYNDCLADDVARETGSDVMRISRHGSDPHCACAAWEGCIISLSGRTKGLPTYEDARRGGCFHPNCVHTLDYVDEDADADEIALQMAHPVSGEGAADADAQDERRYEIDQDRYRRRGLSKEAARVAVDRDNLEAAIRCGLVRGDAAEIVAKMTDAQVTALCPDGNPPRFEPVKRVRGGTRKEPKYEPERWNRGRRGGVVHVSRDADAQHLLEVCKVDGAKQDAKGKWKPEEKKRGEGILPIEEVRKMGVQDALKLKQITDLVSSDMVIRFNEAERLNNADAARVKEIDKQLDALYHLPFQDRRARLDEYERLLAERGRVAREAKSNAFRRNVESLGFVENNCTVRTSHVSPVRRDVFTQAKEGLERLYASEVFPERPMAVNAERGRRSYHRTGELFLSEHCDPSVAVHEASHFVEFGNAHVHERCLEFLRYRTEGERARPLREITGNIAYRRSEIARPDKFFNPYCGKDYGDRATEILSMGVERLTREPRVFYNSDPEYFLFCVGMIRGLL